jgi:AcrR family transcriptional regulator
MARTKADDPEARARIIAAAQKLFAARGYDGTPVRDIARGAGVNGAMIHYYFGSKEGLYRAILASAAAEVRAQMATMVDGAETTRERLTSFVRAYATYIFGHPDLARVLHREFLSGGKHLKEIARQHYFTNYKLMREGIASGVRAGELRRIDIDLAPISLIGMVMIFQLAHPLISVVLGKDEYDEEFIDRLTAHTVDLYLNGAASEKSAAVSSGRRPVAKRRKQVKP